MKYTSIASGIEVEIRKINYYKVVAIANAVEEEMRANGEPIDVPTYDVNVAGSDDVQTHEHYHETETDENGEEVVKRSSLDTEEDHEMWQKHLDARRKQALLYMSRVANFALRTGVIADMNATNWEDDQRYDGINIPDDPRDKYIHYLITEVFPDVIERQEVATQIVNMSIPGHNVAQKQKAVQEFFRRSMDENEEVKPDTD